MFEIITALFILGVVAYVAAPLLKQRQATQQHASEKNSRLHELLYRKMMLQNIVEDLEFDYRTGKLSDEDYASLMEEHQKSQKEMDAQIKSMGGASTGKNTTKLKGAGPVKSKSASEQTPVCPQCKTPVKATDKFCASCGVKLK